MIETWNKTNDVCRHSMAAFQQETVLSKALIKRVTNECWKSMISTTSEVKRKFAFHGKVLKLVEAIIDSQS